jgi:hypothetical protein
MGVWETIRHICGVLPGIPLVVERGQLSVFALVDLGHCLVQEVLRPEVVLVT